MDKDSSWPVTCVSCGKEKTGVNHCVCVVNKPHKVHAVLEPEYLVALASKPEWCECDYPATPHRAGCAPKNRVERVSPALRDEFAQELRDLFGLGR